MSYFNLTTNETTTNFTDETYSAAFELTIQNFVLAIFLIALNVLIIFGNIFVILAICIDFHLRSPTHHLLGSLAVADLLLGTTVLPFSAFQLYFDRWPFGSTFCDLWLAADVLCCTASIYLVLVVSIDRLIGVTKPLRYHMVVTKKRMYLVIAAVWVVSLLVSTLGILWKSPQISTRICEVNQNLVYAFFSASLSFYIPMSIIIIIYYRIYKEARAQMRFLATGTKTSKDIKDKNGNGITLRVHIGPTKNKQNICTCHNRINTYKTASNDVNLIISKSYDESLNIKSKQIDPLLRVNGVKCPVCLDGSNVSITSKNISTSNLNLNISNKLMKFKRERKAAKTLSIVVGCLLLCWTPFFVMLPIEALCKSCQIPKYFFTIFFWLGYCNSAMNPLIYAFSSKEFRRAYKGILQCDMNYRYRKEAEKFSSTYKYKTNILKNNINININNNNNIIKKLPPISNDLPKFQYTFYDDSIIRKSSFIDQD